MVESLKATRHQVLHSIVYYLSSPLMPPISLPRPVTNSTIGFDDILEFVHAS